MPKRGKNQFLKTSPFFSAAKPLPAVCCCARCEPPRRDSALAPPPPQLAPRPPRSPEVFRDTVPAGRGSARHHFARVEHELSPRGASWGEIEHSSRWQGWREGCLLLREPLSVSCGVIPSSHPPHFPLCGHYRTASSPCSPIYWYRMGRGTGW